MSRAVDAKGVDGQAFVTEYAGKSSVVPTNGLGQALHAHVARRDDLDPVFASHPHLPDVALSSPATNHVYCT